MRAGALLFSSLVIAAVALVGCGGDDTQEVRTIVDDFLKADSTAACRLLHPNYRSEIEGLSDNGECGDGLDQTPVRSPDLKVGRITVEGERASVHIESPGSSEAFGYDGQVRLNKIDDGWKIIDVDLGNVDLKP